MTLIRTPNQCLHLTTPQWQLGFPRGKWTAGSTWTSFPSYQRCCDPWSRRRRISGGTDPGCDRTHSQSRCCRRFSLWSQLHSTEQRGGGGGGDGELSEKSGWEQEPLQACCLSGSSAGSWNTERLAAQQEVKLTQLHHPLLLLLLHHHLLLLPTISFSFFPLLFAFRSISTRLSANPFNTVEDKSVLSSWRLFVCKLCSGAKKKKTVAGWRWRFVIADLQRLTTANSSFMCLLEIIRVVGKKTSVNIQDRTVFRDLSRSPSTELVYVFFPPHD